MDNETESNYYEMRAKVERERAESAADPAARDVHVQSAEEYKQRSTTDDRAGRAADFFPPQAALDDK